MKQEELTGVCVCVCKGRSHILFFTFVSFDITRVCTADGRKKERDTGSSGKKPTSFSLCVCVKGFGRQKGTNPQPICVMELLIIIPFQFLLPKIKHVVPNFSRASFSLTQSKPKMRTIVPHQNPFHQLIENLFGPMNFVCFISFLTRKWKFRKTCWPLACQHNRWWLILLQLLYRAYVNVSYFP